MVRAIDRQHSVLQTNITERVQQVQQQHPDLQQRYFDIQLSQERKKMLQKVKDPEETARAKLREAERKKQQKDGQSKDDTRQWETSGESSEDRDPSSFIDIKV
jgi:hypothetical protein